MSMQPSEDEMMKMSDEQDPSGEEVGITLAPETLVNLALKFPCFADAKPETGIQQLFEIILNAYRDDHLSEEQDLVIELILHLHEASSPFNLKRAIEIWSSADLTTFLDIIRQRQD